MTEHDELLMMIAGRAGGIGPLLDAIFSFLYRKTDFYHEMKPGENMGFAPGVAEKLVLGHFRKYEKLALEARAKQARAAPKAAKPAIARVAAATPPDAPLSLDAGAPAALEPAPAATAPPMPHAGARTVDARALSAVRDSHLPATVALESTYNGGQTDKYVWEQTVGDVTIAVPLPTGTRSRDITCSIGRRHLRLDVRGRGEPVLDADYPCDDRNGQCIWEQVKTEQSFWNFNDGKCTIYLEKERECWWKSALHGDVEIDTTAVDSVKRVDDYDGETQGAIRKIMFDQEQKRKGLPTSDELKQMDVLKSAWDAEGSPFKGTPFNPSVLGNMGSTPQTDEIPGMPHVDGPAGPARPTPPSGAAPRNQEMPE
ncbi:hypothetical protein KFE25_007198 [Diacronema lutheri]|uniref:Nuclear migration protein nudC n=2 Tax=Diacronema lutheri TaxID=2081491 RepID=A0A8J5XG03_DIALT|nr:hypothetical protein KFE25_007198 [Diacronema lutheri]